MNFDQFCVATYSRIHGELCQTAAEEHPATKGGLELTKDQLSEIEVSCQKHAIMATTIEAMRHFPGVETAAIWRSIYAAHVNRKSGIIDVDLISKVISADNSWKKSSGHAFEEMVKLLGNAALKEHGIEIVLQKELSAKIRDNEIDNEIRDVSWLKEQIGASTFDLFSIVRRGETQLVFGCIQSKTSIRDRVTRDREPSLQAMNAFFWSVAVVLDGEFLRLQKFRAMVNGETAQYPQNGWHGLYVFSEKYTGDRIYPIGIEMKLFADHAVEAANYWLTQRQWFNAKWRPGRTP